MNLIIQLIFLFSILLAGKIYIPIKVDCTINQNFAMVLLLYIANLFYRIFVNFILNKKSSIKSLFKESFNKTILIIVGIVVVNYLISNPQILAKYGIQIPYTNIYASTALSLTPLVFTRILLADI